MGGPHGDVVTCTGCTAQPVRPTDILLTGCLVLTRGWRGQASWLYCSVLTQTSPVDTPQGSVHPCPGPQAVHPRAHWCS